MTATLDLAPFAQLAQTAQDRDRRGPAAASAREAAFAQFARTGIPTSRHEEWRFTSLRHLAAASFVSPEKSGAVDSSSLDRHALAANAIRVVLVDGRFSPALSRLVAQTGVRIAPLADEPESAGRGTTRLNDATPFAALNTALWEDGVLIEVDPKTAALAAIEILHVATAANALIAPRCIVRVGTRASVSIIENFVSLAGAEYFTNAACEIHVADDARVEHLRVVREDDAASHIGITVVHQGARSHYRSFTLALGGRLVRHNLHAHLDAPGIETLLYGLYIGRGEQVLDNHTAIFHDQPNCNSWEVYKGVLAEKSRGVFNGKVFVQPIAQKTDAKQTNRNLLLSNDARVDTKPQLEIFADDVKCTHGATVGRLDEQQRYYLRTRGIAGRAAELMLISAFVAEVLVEVTDPAIRATLESFVHAEMDELIG